MLNAADPFAARPWRLRAAGLELAAYEYGSAAPGAPVVLLLHGLGHWSDGAWRRLIPYLDASARIVAVDLPGFGASDKPDVRYDRAFFGAVLDGVAASLGVARFALVGHSLGGFLAADWAGANPGRVARLALFAPAAFASTPRHVVLALGSGLVRPMLRRSPPRRIVERIARRSVFDPAALDVDDVARACGFAQDAGVRRAFAGVYAGALEAFAAPRALHADLARYTGPVWCAWGRHDRFIPARTLHAVRRVYPHVQALVLERSGHVPMLEQPEIAGPALRAFLAP